jgi:hypothetical protein
MDRAVSCCSANEKRAREVRDELIRLNAIYLELTCPIQVSNLGGGVTFQRPSNTSIQ